MRKKYALQLCAVVLAVVLLMACIGILVGRGYTDMRKNDADNLLHMYSDNIKLRMRGVLNEAELLAQTIQYTEDDVQERWGQNAAVLLNRDEVRYVCLAQGDKITGALPEETFCRQVGRDLRDFSYVYTLAKVVKELVIEGPITLEETGEEVFLFLQPIVDQQSNAYLGEVGVALRQDYVMEQLGLDYLVEKGYDYELWCVNSQTGDKDVISATGTGIDFSHASKISFYLPTQWNLSIQPADGWLSAGSYALLAGACLLAAAVLIALYYFVRRVNEQRGQRLNLSLIDQQTGLYNRDGFLHALTTQPGAEGNTISLFYFILDGYDRISQVLGSQAESSYLKDIPLRLKDCVKSRYIAGRMGEHSFAVALWEPLDDTQMDDFAKELSLQLLWSVRVKGQTLVMRVCCHHATCNAGGEDIENCLQNLAGECYTI